MDRKRSLSVWDIILWIGIILILLWAFAKSVGWIKSPSWVEMLPFYGIGAACMGGAIKLGKILQKVEDTKNTVDEIKQIEARFNKIENEHNLVMDGKLKIKH